MLDITNSYKFRIYFYIFHRSISFIKSMDKKRKFFFPTQVTNFLKFIKWRNGD